MVLVYLSLEGEKPRRHIADLFWPDKTNKTQRLNNLSRVLSDLRKYAPGTFAASRTHVRSEVDCDVLEFRRALLGGDHQRAEELYRGPFLEGHLSGWGLELEEWIGEQRLLTAQQMQEAYLTLAEHEAARQHFARAASWVQQAHERSDALEPDLSKRFYTLLAAADHPLAGAVRRDMADYDIGLSLSKEEARLKLSPTFIGREREKARLQGLEDSSWAWLRGAQGMGKTSLLKHLPGTFLSARSGTPFATLEPLLGADVRRGRAWILQSLYAREGTWLFDDWEEIDAESRELLVCLHRSKPHIRVVITGETPPPFPVDAVVELGPLSSEALEAYPDVWDKTGGLPALVHACLQGEAPEHMLDSHLATFSEEVKDVFFSLALLEVPCPELVRRALGLSAEALTGALDALSDVGFVIPAGRVRARSTALKLLSAYPSRHARLALEVARYAASPTAFALYQQTRAFWTEKDRNAARLTYVAYADELRKGGDPRQADTILRETPREEARLAAPPTEGERVLYPDESQPSVVERRFPRWWTGAHVAGFSLIALFSSRGSADTVATVGIVLTTVLVLTALLYLGWRLVRRELSSIRWSGVGAAVAVGVALAVATSSRAGQVEGLVCLGSVATVVGTGATIGAAKGWVAGLVGSGFAALGALFAAVQLVWGQDTGLLRELDMTPALIQLTLGLGSALWGYVLALIILSTLKSRSVFTAR